VLYAEEPAVYVLYVQLKERFMFLLKVRRSVGVILGNSFFLPTTALKWILHTRFYFWIVSLFGFVCNRKMAFLGGNTISAISEIICGIL
jgi:hypothetical protein